MMRLKGKVAVITGGNSGIGLATAVEFKQQGASGVILGRDRKTLDAAQNKLGAETLVVQGDVANLADIDRLYKQTVDRFGNIDIVVANAAVSPFKTIDQVDEAFFDDVFNINIKGAYFTVQKALAHLNDGASIIMVSSINHTQGLPGLSVYAASKAAQRSLARTLSADLLDRGIRVNCVSPGPIDTPIYDKLNISQQDRERVSNRVPLKRMGTSEEVAKAVLFFASSDSSFILGEDIKVDGGWIDLNIC